MPLPPPPPDPPVKPMQTPNEVLAEQITEQLIIEKLIPEAKRAEILERLSKGSITTEDWKLYVEMAIEKTEETTTHADAD